MEYNKFINTSCPIDKAIYNCTSWKSVGNGEEIWFRVRKDGEIVVGLHFWLWPVWLKVSKSAGFCFRWNSHVQISQENTTIIDTNNRSQNLDQILWFCELEDYSIYILHRLLYGICFTISAFSLFLLISIMIISRRNRGLNIQFGVQISYFISAFLCYFVEGARIWIKFDGLSIQPGSFCFYHAVIAQCFSFISASTLFAFSAHLLWNFWKMQPLITTRITRLRKREIFIWIGLPWILPTIALFGGLIYNHYTNPLAPKQEIGIFEYAHFRCSSPAWFVGTVFYTIMFVLVSFQYAITAGVIIGSFFATKFASKSSNKKFASEILKVLIKLSLATGMFWGFLIYEVCFGENAATPLHWAWELGRIFFFCLQGLWLFIAFGLNKIRICK